ncbi:FxSxx-COOH system tetratricopeptide repeat protein [Nonomuraea sp. NPDC049421]|uniref:FxSxx-COOH system tetratricopeptide repeat protein n=1 Tax=Nonomuraea sp. NPDC049421 TaxID=3155275 RepID=UPI0034149B9A
MTTPPPDDPPTTTPPQPEGLTATGSGAVEVRMEATASGNARIYQAGRDQVVNETVLPEIVLRPVTEVVAPPGLVNLPRHTRTFVGRGDELARLEVALRGGNEVVVSAVHGLGGVGKSTLAAHYALAQARRQDAGRPNPVWWITAESGQAVRTGLARLAVALQPELTTALPLEALAERATAWLAAHQGWLLVLDNVDEVADVQPLLRRVLTGKVLVTSRLGEGWHRLDAQVLRLDVLSEREAIELLTRLAAPELVDGGNLDGAVRSTDAGDPGRAAATEPGESGGLDGAAELVRELGYLPLAIEQAGAYLHQTRITPREYLELLRRQPAVMYDQVARGGDAERTIARVWRLTLDRLAGTPYAVDVLRVLAWYGAQPVPRILLDGMDAGQAEVRHALGELAAYNMVTLDRETVTVHRLVQAVTRTPDDADPHRPATAVDAARTQATALLDTAAAPWPRDPAGWPLWRALLPHVIALTEHAAPGTDTLTTAGLLDRTGVFLNGQGSLESAIELHTRARATCERLLGEDDPATLSSSDGLASAYRAMGDLEHAVPIYEETLERTERLLGTDAPQTLTTRNNLAAAYEAAGDLRRAIPIYEQTLDSSQRVLGADHPDTLTTRSNLALAYQTAGNLSLATRLFRQTLEDRERVLGPDHPDTLTSRNNLAHAYREAGDLRRAAELDERTLADRERVLGPDHPDTLTSRSNLAVTYEWAGDLRRAVALFEQALEDRERVLGPDHRDTLTSRNNLAHAYEAAGNVRQALRLYERNLKDRERLLGPDHPDTLISRNNLAHTYQSAGDLAEARRLHEQNLKDRERLLGPDHPDTLISRNNLAHAYQAAGDLDHAIPLFQRTLEDRERVLGPTHPATLNSRNNLAIAYDAAGDSRRALRLLVEILVDRERILGPDHPDTLASRNNLAYAYESAGNHKRAVQLYEETYAGSERVLGPDHPDTLMCRNNLAAAYHAAGDVRRATPLLKRALAECERVLGPGHPTTTLVRANLRAVLRGRP